MQRGKWVHHVIFHQQETWTAARQTGAVLEPGVARLVVGSGSSYYLAQVIAEMGKRRGYQIAATAAGDVVMEPDLYLSDVGELVVTSRSGASSEALWAMEEAKRRNIRTLAVTCDSFSPLAERSDRSAVVPEGDDGTVVMIRSFTSMLTLLQQALAGPIPPLELGMEKVLSETSEWLEESPRLPRRVYLLGSGVRLGLVHEGALKVQEMAGTVAYSYSPLEFRHGPRGQVSAEDWIVLLGQTTHAGYEYGVLTDLASQGPTILVVAEPQWFAKSAASSRVVNRRVTLPSEEADDLKGPLAIVPLQMLAWHLAMKLGRNPDAPENLTKVVEFKRN